MQAEGRPDKLRSAKQAYDAVSKKYQRSFVGKLAAENAVRLERAAK